MKYPKLRELKEAVRALIKGPVTTSYPYKPHTPMPGFRGKPVPSNDDCIACGACAQICPARAIEVTNYTDEYPARRAVTWRYDICIFCGQCEALCTTKTGVVLSDEYDLACFDRSTLTSTITKDLVLCEECDTIIGTKPQFEWTFRRLGPLSSGNFNLVNIFQRLLGMLVSVPSVSSKARTAAHRADMFKILCPKCRHQVLVFNQTGVQPPKNDHC